MSFRPLRRSGLCLLLLCAAAPAAGPAAGQGPEQGPDSLLRRYGLQTWGYRDGLPQATVRAIGQTRDGYLWLGTQNELVRFDGIRFTVADGRGGPLAVLGDRAGGLWYAPFGRGVTRKADGRATTWTARDGLPGEIVQQIFEDRDGAVWLGTSGGLARWSGGGRLETIGGLDGRSVTALAQGPDGALWIGTSAAGVFRLASGSLSRITASEDLPGDQIAALLVDRNGDLWVGTPRGIGRLRNGRWEQLSTDDGLPGNDVTKLLEAADGSLWVGTRSGLAVFLEEGRFASLTERDGLRSEAIAALFQDVEGSVWVGTEVGGLARLRDTTFTNLEHLGVRGGIWSIVEDRAGTLWLGTNEHGLLRLQGGRVTAWTAADGLPDNRVRPILEDRRGDLWLGTSGGLVRMRGGRFETWTRRDGLPVDYVLALFEDRDGALWIGTNEGLARLRDGRLEAFLEGSGLPGAAIRSIRRDHRGVLLVGTRYGLFRQAGGRFERVPGGPEAQIFVVREDPDGTLWVGTGRAGLQRLRGGRWTAFRRRDGLVEDTIYQILEDRQGRFWMSGNRGIFRVRRADLEAFAAAAPPLPVAVVRRGRRHGGSRVHRRRQSARALVAASDGRFWFPTVRGFAVTDPGAAGAIGGRLPWSSRRSSREAGDPLGGPGTARARAGHERTWSCATPPSACSRPRR